MYISNIIIRYFRISTLFRSATLSRRMMKNHYSKHMGPNFQFYLFIAEQYNLSEIIFVYFYRQKYNGSKIYAYYLINNLLNQMNPTPWDEQYSHLYRVLTALNRHGNCFFTCQRVSRSLAKICYKYKYQSLANTLAILFRYFHF